MWENIEKIVPRDYAYQLVADTTAEIFQMTAGKKTAYAWSGGKDSIALQVVMEQAGITECVMGISELEYPAFLAWVTDHMPWGLHVINTGQNLEWLSRNQHMLFPQDSATAAKWFQIIQHKAQALYFKENKLDVVILGRRHADGNFTGKDGSGAYTSNGITRYSPIRHWTHEDVLAVIHYFNKPMPPIYEWVNGFIVGTGAWAARQWTGSITNGWREVYSIDPSVVREAADYIPSAKQFLEAS